MDQSTEFDYSNLSRRPSGLILRTAARFIPGVGIVQRQVPAYANAWRLSNLEALKRPGPRWVVLGDSMSQGIGATSFDAGWVNQVGVRLAGEGIRYNIVNLSASGAQVSDVLAYQLPAWRTLPPAPDSADLRPDLITLLIGSNDLIRKQYREQLPARFAQLLQQLPAGTVVSTLPNPRRAAAAANRLMEQARLKRGLVLADMRSGRMASWRGRLAEDHFHPNDLGYAGIASVFFEAIEASVRTPATG